MYDNYDTNKDFESNVRARLDDLDFVPSKSVWDNIDAQLPAERKRRGGFFLISSLLLGAAAVCGYLFFNQNTATYQVNTSTLSSSTVSEQSTISIDKSTGTASQPSKTSLNSSITANESDIAAQNANLQVVQPMASAKKTNGSKNIQKKSLAFTQFIDTEMGKVPDSDNQTSANATLVPVSSVTSGDISATHPLKPAEVNAPAYHGGFNVSPVHNVVDILRLMALEPVTDLAMKKGSKWNFEVTASAGQSIFNSGKVEHLFTAAQSTVINDRTLVNTGLWLPPLTPSDVKPGKGFSVGMDARFQKSMNVSFTIGLHYSLLTTKIKTGDKADYPIRLSQPPNYQIQVPEFYNLGSHNNYINRYHFIEMPLLAHFKLNRGEKVPLYLDGGLAIAQLIATNMLHYDGNANVYFEDKSLVQKTFANAQVGFTAKLFADKRFPIIVGPKIQYGLTNLFKGKVMSENREKHSLMLGLKLGVPLNF